MRSAAWGGLDVAVNQEFNEYNPYYAETGGYDYVEAYGLKKGHHGGLDIGVEKGTPLFALNPGTVTRAGFSDSFRPSPVWIETEDNPETLTDERGFTEIWGHMWTNTVKAGDTVKPGQNIGASGEQTYLGTWTPDESGPHLHFELRQGRNGGKTIIDPTAWLTGARTTSPDDPAPDGEAPGEAAPDSGLPGTLAEIGRRAGVAVLGGALLLIGVFILVSGTTPAGAVYRRLRGNR